jgi:tetratricopeptide (TPR) repeat protein
MACFGHDDLIEEIVTLVEGLTPVALIGAGGIGKTSIALTVLHHDRIKQRFGEDRRFIRCDQFPATLGHLLSRLSKVTGAGVKNPEDLTPLSPHLSSKEMIVVLDNAESILDPQGTDAAKIYALVEELSQLPTLCLCITSRISTIPPEYETFEVPTLSMDAACCTFYRIYKRDKRSNLVNDILGQLDFHALSIVLLATVAHQNKWGVDQLEGEWERHLTSVLQTRHKKSLAATIELSLASPMFQEFGPDARALLGVIAFFPQGVDRNNLDWLFPTISSGADILDGFCVLSLTYRINGFITMLAPLRDYLSPEDPKLSPFLCTAKEHYFVRMSVDIDPDKPIFKESQWITSEDVNVEHLLNVFTTIDDSDSTWDTCINFMRHLYWHKKRLTVLTSKIEELPDDHRRKPECLVELSRLFYSVGNQVERKRLLTHALKLERERGNDGGVARILWQLSIVNRSTDPKEGIRLAKEALEIYERLSLPREQAQCLLNLARLLNTDQQSDAAEEAASRAISLLPENGKQFLVCESHCLLGDIHRSKGEIEKAIYHNKVALGIASPFDWHATLFRANYSLAVLFLGQGRFDDIHAHTERAKSHTVDSAYNLGVVTMMEAFSWSMQHKIEEARTGILHAINIFEKLGAVDSMEKCRGILRDIQERQNSPVSSGQSGFDCEFLQMMPFLARVNSLF